MSDLLARLDEACGTVRPSVWIPKVGETIIGRVLRRDEIRTRWGLKPYVALRCEDGRLLRVILSSQLGDLLAEAQDGDRVAIRYLGRPGKRHEYAAVIEKKSAAVES